MRARLRVSDLVRMALAWAISSLSLIAADLLLSGLHAESNWSLVAAAAVTGVFGVLLRPVLVKVASAIGWLAVGALAIAGQAVLMHLALLVLPGVDVSSFWTLVAATWIAATVSTFLTWLVTAGTEDAFTVALRRFGVKKGRASRTRRWTGSSSCSWTGCRSRSPSGRCSPGRCRPCAGG